MKMGNFGFYVIQFDNKEPVSKIALIDMCSDGTVCKRRNRLFDFSEYYDEDKYGENVWETIEEVTDEIKVFASFKASRSEKTLGDFFRKYNIKHPEGREFICCHKLIRKYNLIDPSINLTYENVAREFGLDPVIDLNDALQKAWFAVKILVSIAKSGFEIFSEPADFSEPVERETHFQKEIQNVNSKTKLKKYMVDELLKRPKEKRFEGTYVAFTGAIKKSDGSKHVLRKNAIESVRKMGGYATKNFDENVTHLVVGKSSGRKTNEADELGAVIISVDDFYKLTETK